jgi:hypothetical protein
MKIGPNFVKNEIKALAPPPYAAWIQGVLREIDEPLIFRLHLFFALHQFVRNIGTFYSHDAFLGTTAA